MTMDDLQKSNDNKIEDPHQPPGQNINTGGGASAHGDVNTGGGDFVGRDQINIYNIPSGVDIPGLPTQQDETASLKVPGYLEEAIINKILGILGKVRRGDNLGLDTLLSKINVSKNCACDHLEYLVNKGLIRLERTTSGASTWYFYALTDQGRDYVQRREL